MNVQKKTNLVIEPLRLIGQIKKDQRKKNYKLSLLYV